MQNTSPFLKQAAISHLMGEAPLYYLFGHFGKNSTPLLTINYFYPRMGGGSFSFTDNSRTTIVGPLDLVGTEIDNTSYQARYQAHFSGSYIDSVQYS